MKKILYLLLAVVGAIAVSCGQKAEKAEPEADGAVLRANEENNSRLAVALNGGQLGEASAMADSMALMVDDLTPEQTVQVLTAFLTIHNEAVRAKETRKDLETLRKYVDVYDIALSANPADTRAAFEKARRLNPSVNFDSVAAAFRERLTQYDAIHDGSLNAPEPADTVAADTVAASDEVPLELRPAE
ncbi:MAG: hypothetical protein K2H83_00310 [Duncaniella sp.]|nr:hypothetical protein [Duncaniella sp.]MDE5733567.1 hypothetical protein [Duncaniella sp.]MDE6178474.1 hypothetical protein [Duncaniella sp.]MDE6389956.1 hypothetical protein [Duncaniella sp.]